MKGLSSSALAVEPGHVAIVPNDVVVHRRRVSGGGGVSPDTFTANWLHVEGEEGGGLGLDTFTGNGCKVRGGGGGGLC